MQDLEQSGVYVVKNTISGKVYVGSARRLATRWEEHRSLLDRGRHYNRQLQGDWQSYGARAFEYAVVTTTIDAPRALEAAEQHWLNHYRTVGAVYNRRHAVWRADTPGRGWEAHYARLARARLIRTNGLPMPEAADDGDD